MFVGPVVLDKHVKFHDPSLNRSQEIPHKAAWGSILDCFFSYNFWPEVDNDVISGTAVDNVGMDVPLNLVILGQTVFEIFEQLISCLTNNTHGDAYPISAKCQRRFA